MGDPVVSESCGGLQLFALLGAAAAAAAALLGGGFLGLFGRCGERSDLDGDVAVFIVIVAAAATADANLLAVDQVVAGAAVDAGVKIVKLVEREAVFLGKLLAGIRAGN